ncbi:hypothetical protein MMC07_006164 [Pseudocyphellaria aurata]|nr:hypothetical protein [Pseudocyphellaria aurata]
MRKRTPTRAGALLTSPSPLKILTQILTLQAAYYVVATFLILFTALAAGKPFSPDLVLSWRSLRGDTTVGWTLGLCWVLVGGLGKTATHVRALLILLLIARSKLVPDFTLTLHFLHLVATSLYSRSVPRNWLWWLLQAVSAGVMTSLGVWTCRWRELQPINFGSRGAGEEDGGGRNSKDASRDFVVQDEDVARGKGRGGGVAYEMVGLIKGGAG